MPSGLETWIVSHAPEGVMTAIMAWLGYAVKQRDKRLDFLEEKIDEMPFIYVMKDDVKEIKSDIKEIKKYLLENK